jgi:PKD domain
MRRYSLTIGLTLLISLVVATSGAQAVVVNDQGSRFGVALVPGTRSSLTTAGISTVTSSAPCADPALSPDLTLPDTGLCWHGGAVMNKNETFALTWDPVRRYWQTTRNYVEQFLRDVADGSGKLSSPYALTTQYTAGGPSSRAQNASVYGGGCIDFGNPGSSTCKLGDANGSGAGHDYPASGCPVSGTNSFDEAPNGAITSSPNDVCLTAAQVNGEVATMVSQSGMLGHTRSGYSPMLTVMTPPGVEVCLDNAGNLCSANGNSTAQFCSYHSQADVGGTKVSYVVQPWTALSGCDDPDVTPLPPNPDVQLLAKYVGAVLVSPISQGQLASIVNPSLYGWSALDGSEINDNGCTPLGNPGNPLDSATVGSSSQNPYMLQREFNNAGVIETDPNALRCMPLVNLVSQFVVPSAVNRGDVVEFDGSTTISSLIVPKADYRWSFGDGTTAVGASVVHSYGAAGTYSVKLAVTDRGGNVSSLIQPIDVLGGGGEPSFPGGSSGPSNLHVRLQLMPQGLRAMLRSGLAVRVSSNEPAAGVASLSISRRAARRAHIGGGHGRLVVIGRGTVSQIKDGTVTLHLHLHLSHSTAAKLQHLRHVAVTVRLALRAGGGDHVAVDAAARY